MAICLGPAALAGEDCDSGSGGIDVLEADVLRVATLNVAHGRKDAANQMLLSEETIRANLRELAGLLDRAEADAIALQEADAASAWSGGFDHVAFLLGHSRYRCSVHGIHASNRLYDFGTALISPHALRGSFVHTFAPSRPTTTKGFVVGALAWNPGGALGQPLLVKLVSVHLDFSRQSVRRAQVEELVRVLGKLEGPLVLMGDFNTDWDTEGSSLRTLARQLELNVFEPESDALATYGDNEARLDWILVSRELQFTRHRVFPDIVSDHLAVLAELRLAQENSGED
jgi:endonuclease/exonuclease/phosphatase family metal-dependent hydrolase